ncbi:7-cyano-7-deazaguanine synthase QueC [Sporolactobacillus terrae]|uniref:7-cyano-7-deazaguanine synthase n=1 Tax=Sporolactobacillus terrae TaxID=269673 RepID=A0A410D5Q2_9BACL|nr:7-cyano-7-deazaguanine synthase QueC [Sporolactobacillus terrae]QAA21437.1 7-cyano-7-deazaguanine synthase QueC [Sporolactobacillus terrae]QAA24409.1 7-cyano-7-deazaguanine synthase QueC [Sporolactobacillus terrae]UAK16235.1 7-cyano-7-deazaguanine synthase QueC [Sporolactobacillus terrae]BBN97701.1 7-cyano-7-deazaguanine synthase [Sporolactobacillus terrae]
MKKRAVVVLSGGLDSTTCMGVAKDQGYELWPMTFSYGQRHDREVEQARKIADYFQVNTHRIVNLDFFKQLGGSALTDQQLDVPQNEENPGIPITYVPARNMIFLALASAYAEVIGASAVFTGVSSVDYSGYPDCRPEFIESMAKTVNLATRAGVTEHKISIETPLMHLTKAETIRLGTRLHVPYERTTSCYNGGDKACGTCDSCRLRIKGFQEAGLVDPIDYAIPIDWSRA